MWNYDEIKNQLEQHKQKFVLGACFVLVFIIGFGMGKFESNNATHKSSSQNNYTTNSQVKAKPKVLGEQTEAAASPEAKNIQDASEKNVSNDKNCPVKGNISDSGKKIYHVVGGAFYKIVKPEQCFTTEAQASAAGFIKSSR